MSKKDQSTFNIRRSFGLTGIDVVFALASMMMVVRWRLDWANEPKLIRSPPQQYKLIYDQYFQEQVH